MKNSIEEFLKDKQDDIDKLTSKLEVLKKIKEEFLDLKRGVNRWGQEFFYSKDVNPIADQYSISKSCGCYDAAVLLFLGIEKYGLNIYTDNNVEYEPFSLTIGEGCFCGAYRIHEGWEAKLKVLEIPDKLIEEIKEEFKKSKYNCACAEEKSNGA